MSIYTLRPGLVIALEDVREGLKKGQIYSFIAAPYGDSDTKLHVIHAISVEARDGSHYVVDVDGKSHEAFSIGLVPKEHAGELRWSREIVSFAYDKCKRWRMMLYLSAFDTSGARRSIQRLRQKSLFV